MSAQNGTRVLWKASQCSLLLIHLASPLKAFLKLELGLVKHSQQILLFQMGHRAQIQGVELLWEP